MRNRLTIGWVLPFVALLSVGCAVQRDYTYLKDAPRDQEMPVNTHYTTRIFPDDRLYIYVYSQTPESVVPFNEETRNSEFGVRSSVSSVSSPTGYLVAADGSIHFPMLGPLSTTGLTSTELAHEIERRLIENHYVSDPIVTVSLMNFRATIIGEVATPQQIHTDGNRLTIFEAIALCGDITMDGMRNCVVVVRKTDGNETIDTIDLTSRTMLDSPYYYLQQNDIVYVTPTKKKQRTAYRNEQWPTYLATGVSAVNLAYQTIYRFINPNFRRMMQEAFK